MLEVRLIDRETRNIYKVVLDCPERPSNDYYAVWLACQSFKLNPANMLMAGMQWTASGQLLNHVDYE